MSSSPPGLERELGPARLGPQAASRRRHRAVPEERPAPAARHRAPRGQAARAAAQRRVGGALEPAQPRACVPGGPRAPARSSLWTTPPRTSSPRRSPSDASSACTRLAAWRLRRLPPSSVAGEALPAAARSTSRVSMHVMHGVRGRLAVARGCAVGRAHSRRSSLSASERPCCISLARSHADSQTNAQLARRRDARLSAAPHPVIAALIQRALKK